jgi:hypothetical protein
VIQTGLRVGSELTARAGTARLTTCASYARAASMRARTKITACLSSLRSSPAIPATPRPAACPSRARSTHLLAEALASVAELAPGALPLVTSTTHSDVLSSPVTSSVMGTLASVVSHQPNHDPTTKTG